MIKYLKSVKDVTDYLVDDYIPYNNIYVDKEININLIRQGGGKY